ncbi:MAG: Gfo/Idh/MocA family oxidoreductase [Planctomyces sp.]
MTKLPPQSLEQHILQSVQPVLPQQRSVGIGCIGAGFIMADCHLAAYAAHQLRPAAITSRTLSSAEAAAARWQIPSVCQTVEEVVVHPEVQLLDVAVQQYCQAYVIRRAIRRPQKLRGILAKKPLGINCR